MKLTNLKKSVVASLVASVFGTLLCSAVYAADANKPGAGVSITPIFPTIAEERFRGEVVIAGLKDLGYDVKQPKEVDYPAMFLALSYGDADFTVHEWEHLHQAFYEKAGGDDVMVKVGQVMKGVLQGYMIDKKTAEAYQIKDLSDLKKPEIAKLFDSNGDGKADLTGCNPGWGCEIMVEHHMKAYGLGPTVVDNRGSYFALMADTIARFQQGKPVLFFTWVPQWIASVLVEGRDVVWLPVPFTSLPDGQESKDTFHDGKNLGFPVDTINAVMSKEFAEKNPVARKFLSEVSIPTAAESAQNLRMQQGEKSLADIKRHAAEWIKANQQAYDGWLSDARAAAK
ncbi:glycine betaine/L-proline ABC transporter substrate-binding protein ProX [Pseudomonas neuropathica]|uniref:glycine betaine/L-proline ABC transporter substrate-binding protein ProX n=1 Tax=Pseudomonas neuropathica TaxID=2730425 RepID=UPI003EBB07ED